MHPLLVCPACRHARTLSVRDGLAACAHCRAAFPLLAGLPALAHPVGAFVRGLDDSRPGLPDEERVLAPFLADDAPLSRRLQRTSVAARAHFGDRTGGADESAWRTFSPYFQHLPRGTLLELGAGAGRLSLELAGDRREVVALDTDPAVLAIGARIEERGETELLLRTIGATYAPARIRAPELRGRPVTFVLGDALDPPLTAGTFDAVVAMNLLDNVRAPSTLLGQVDALLKPGGTLLLSTPYAWDSHQVDDGERIGGAAGRPFGGDPATELRRVLTADGLDVPWRFELVRDDPHVPWTLVRDARCRFQYDLHVVVARKLS